jgi:hypothetical protein
VIRRLPDLLHVKGLTMSVITSAPRWSVVLVGAALVVGGVVAGVPAAAVQDPGVPSVSVVPRELSCHLTRVGTQLVRCDNLTGLGNPAAPWVPES